MVQKYFTFNTLTQTNKNHYVKDLILPIAIGVALLQNVLWTRLIKELTYCLLFGDFYDFVSCCGFGAFYC